ncbi:MAG TPA: phosphatase PAP2 family protein [Actinomycetota bacterium]|nr:phosphatase PAP2 family protein [Actinomycetota bacterium]
MRNRRDSAFTPHPGTPASRIGTRMRGHRPFVVGLAVWAVELVVLAVAVVAFGLLLVHVLVPAGVGRLDFNIAHWFVNRRTPTLNDVTLFVTNLGSTPVVVGIAVLACIALAIAKRWRQVGFMVATMTLEFIVFLTAALLVDRTRPDVPRLDSTPPTSSYPSGHTAASVALWVGLAVVIWSLTRSVVARTIAWILAVAVPLAVGLSRMYRGMHHFTDVAASAVLGSAAVACALIATRSAVAAHEARDGATVSPPQSERPLQRAS